MSRICLKEMNWQNYFYDNFPAFAFCHPPDFPDFCFLLSAF